MTEIVAVCAKRFSICTLRIHIRCPVYSESCSKMITDTRNFVVSTVIISCIDTIDYIWIKTPLPDCNGIGSSKSIKADTVYASSKVSITLGGLICCMF